MCRGKEEADKPMVEIFREVELKVRRCDEGDKKKKAQ